MLPLWIHQVLLVALCQMSNIGQLLPPVLSPLSTSERGVVCTPNQSLTLANLGQLGLINIWYNIPQAFLNTLVASMRRCCQANGGHMHYLLGQFKFEYQCLSNMLKL